MRFAHFLRAIVEVLRIMPTWVILSFLFVVLLICYYIRPDNVTEDTLKGVIGALLLSIQPRQQPPPPPAAPVEGPPSI